MNDNGIVGNLLTLKKYIVFCIALFTSAMHSSDMLSDECVKIIVLDVLKSNWKQTQEIALVSKQCNRIIINIINDIKLLKAEHLKLAKTAPISSSKFARRHAPHTYKIYTAVNEALLKESNLKQYATAIEKNPFADIHYVNGSTFKLNRIVFFKEPKSFDDMNLITETQTKELWIKMLCEQGATIHQYTSIEHTVFRCLVRLLLSPCIGYDEKQRKYVPTFILLLKYAKKEISEEHLIFENVLKRDLYDARYLDGKPFMQDCIDYLKLVKKHGFDVKKVYPNPLHFHMYKNPHPAPAMIEYLLAEGFDPYEKIDMRDGLGPQSAYSIAQARDLAQHQERQLQPFEEFSEKEFCALL